MLLNEFLWVVIKTVLQTEQKAARLQERYRVSPVFKDVLRFFMANEEDGDLITLDRLELSVRSQTGRKYDRSELVKVFYYLRGECFGTFKVGRHGNPSRFISDMPLSEIGKMAAGVADSNDVEVEPGETSKLESTATLQHSFILRTNLTIRIDLPHDLTAMEAGRLADFVRSLPFN
jgi:hypothetical protein